MDAEEKRLLIIDLIKVETRLDELKKQLGKTEAFQGHELVDEFMSSLEKYVALRQKALSANKE